MTNVAIDALIERFASGDRSALARLLTYVENQREIAAYIVGSLPDRNASTHVIGVTGPPGVGKSTLIGALVREFRQRGQKVGVLAVDPSSDFTGGATLGDRIRMSDVWNDPSVFIRSIATRGQLGGLSRSVGDAQKVLAAFGFDVVLVETVGVGQDEIDVSKLVQTTVLVQVPGLGDEIQVIKAGVFEIADILVVNKGDHPGAEQLVNDLRRMLERGAENGWNVPILETIATTGCGVSGLVEALERHRRFLLEAGQSSEERIASVRQDVRRFVLEHVSQSVDNVLCDPSFEDELSAAARGETSISDLGELALSRITNANAGFRRQTRPE